MTLPNCSRCGAPFHDAGNLRGVCPRCLLAAGPEVIWTKGAAPPEQDLVAVQQLFPELEIAGLLGRGGMGVVYRARQVHLDRQVALKLLAPEVAADRSFADRFAREARALARLAHPNIVGVYDFGERSGTFFLAMEFVDGTSLRELMRQRVLEPAEALAVVPQICEGLQYAHGQGVVHRDIKPENILVDRDGRVKIADFGLAKLLGNEPDHLTRANQVMGTPHYMAPEQVNTPLLVDHRADIYSLGVVLYEMLTRELPVGAFAPPSRRARVDARLDRVVQKALEQQPDRRYQKASEVKTDVERVQGKPADPAPGEGVLRWIDAFPDGPIVIAWGGIGLAAGWFFWLHSTGEVFREDWIAASYPPAFVGFAAMRSPQMQGGTPRLWRPDETGDVADSRVVMQVFAFLCSAFAAMCAASDSWSVIQGLAAVLLVLGHLLYDRWVWGHGVQSLVGGVPLFLLATIVHASEASQSGAEALAYASGMLGLISAASILPALPEFARRDHHPEVTRAVVRGLAVGVVAAAIYFRDFL